MMQLSLLLPFFVLVTISSALECYVNRTHVEECSQAWSYLFPVFCYNRTEEMDNGKHRHTFGCADLKMRTLPMDTERGSYCSIPNNKLGHGHGKLCICTKNKCNYNPHKLHRAVWYSSSFASLPSLTLLAGLALL